MPGRLLTALLCCVVTLLVALPLSSLGERNDGLVVKTEAGKLQGKGSGVSRAFLGIPYAAPPVGDLRWKAPASLPKWKGVRSAKDFGSRCMQAALYTDMIFRDAGVSEDCLTLNVWTEATDTKAKLPVMVWIYGGGFVTGGTSEQRQDGAALAKRGVVVVSMNYRLGVFGFLVHPELTKESGNNSSGNYGLLDQVAALQWVQKNIKEFGGDPGNVTIFGESAGSFSVSSLMASPLAKGLFHKAIGESGGAFQSETLPYKTREAREALDVQWAQKELGMQSLKQLRALPAQQLLDAAMKADKSGVDSFTPDVDGYFLPEDVTAIFAAGKQNDVPLLAGWNHDEGAYSVAFAANKPSLESLKLTATTRFPGRSEDFLKVYAAHTDEEAARATRDLAGDQFIAWSAWKWLEAQTTTGKQPVYRYRFDLAPPPDKNTPAALGAFHSSEIVYVFGDLDARPLVPWRDEDRKLSALMQQYWTNFATKGDPNGPGLPQWPVYAAKDGWPLMFLSADSKADKDSQRDRYLFLNSTQK